MTDEPFDAGANSALEDVLITEQLTRRSARAPDHETEARMLGMLARRLAHAPARLLEQVADAAMSLCHADAAAVAIVERGEEEPMLRWHAVAGACATRLGARAPLHASPEGVALRSETVELFERPGRYFPLLRGATPPIH